MPEVAKSNWGGCIFALLSLDSPSLVASMHKQHACTSLANGRTCHLPIYNKHIVQVATYAQAAQCLLLIFKQLLFGGVLLPHNVQQVSAHTIRVGYQGLCLRDCVAMFGWPCVALHLFHGAGKGALVFINRSALFLPQKQGCGLWCGDMRWNIGMHAQFEWTTMA